MNYSLLDISNIIDAKINGNSSISIKSICIDSRKALANVNVLFFALVGKNHNGHQFIAELYQKGIRAFVVSEANDYKNIYPDAGFLIVDNTLAALQKLASYHRGQFKYTTVGITGSNGKTIVKEWLYQLLCGERRIVRSPKSYNSQVGVPLSVLQMTQEYDFAVFEAGISQPNEMDRLEPIIAPNIGIFTNIGSAHQENFPDLKSKVKEKMKLFANTKVLIYCSDSSLIDSIAKQEATKGNINLFTWGKNKTSNVLVLDTKKLQGKTTARIVFQKDSFTINIPFTDDASIENAMHCLCAMLILDIPIKIIAERLERLTPVAMRLELKEGINGCTIINDTYNSDIGSLSIALDFLAQQRQHPEKILVISDILQSGTHPELLYSEVANMAKIKGVDKMVGIGNVISSFSNLFPPNSVFYPDSQSFIKSINRQSFSNAAILLKGSRVFQFEHISTVLEQKTHRTVLEIDMNALVNNLNYFRSLLNPHVKVMAMVKAFSYGSGSHEIANLLQYHRVDYLGVAFADEGVALREAGISLPIVVLNPEFGSYEVMIDYNLEPEIFSFTSLENFVVAVNKKGVSSYPVHIKIDSGMHRLGFLQNEIEKLAIKLNENESIKVESIFSHLAGSDEREHDGFTKNQIDLFEQASRKLSQLVGYSPIRHILNSAGIERFKDAQFDMVRLGIGLYGVSTVSNSKLQNVSTLKSFVAQLRELPKGETVGYSRKGLLKRCSTIATIPIGYADGLSRALSNGVGSMLIKGETAPIIGNISMDTCAIDVTDIPSINVGDEVIVFGEKPSIIEIANALNTIPYEVLTSVSRRVKRIYIQE